MLGYLQIYEKYIYICIVSNSIYMLRAYKYRIYPTDEQKVLFAKTFGCCRFVYNWGLNMKIEAYKQEKRTIPYKEMQEQMVNDLKKKMTGLRKSIHNLF